MNVKMQLYRLTAILMVALLAFGAMPAKQASAAPNRQPSFATVTITSTQNWNVPAGVTSVRVEAWGGGGGGGGAFNTNNYKGGGGAGGQYVIGVVDVTPLSNVTVTIGAGGAGGNSATTNGAAGGDTSFGSLVVAKGGAGGVTMSSSTGYNGAAGLGSNSGATVPLGGTVYRGGNGSNGGSGAPAGGAGGGGAGSTGNGGDASGNTAGTGTTAGGGNGGAGRTSAGAGNSGSTYGGGGGGGLRIGGTERNGGAGAAGRIVITYFTVTFDGNGSTGGAMNTLSGAKSTALTTNAFTRTGYIFDGWATSPAGPVVYNDGDAYSFASDITLYAHWTLILPDTPSVSNSPQTYTGSPITITVSCDSGGIATNITPASATNAGDYPVTADCPGNGGSYSATVGESAGTFTINKATPTATLSVDNSPVTYNGNPQAANVVISVSSVPGTVANTLTGGAANQTNANTYAVTADFVPNDTDNYNSLTGLSAGNFIIEKATPTLSVDNSPVTYNGAPQAAVVSGSVAGSVTNVLYDGSSTVPTNAGTYAITANFTPTDTTNYNSLTGASAGDFVIDKASPTVSVDNSPVTYNGAPQAADVSGSVAGSVSDVKYDGSSTIPTNAGTYAVTADFTSSDPNYGDLNDAPAGNFVIEKATPTASIINSPVVYSGSEQTATVACSGGGSATLVSGGVGTNAGSYPATVDCEESANYVAASGLAAGNFVIDKATPTASITNSPVVYNGSEQTATVACLGGGTATLASGGVGTNAGSYPATVDCAESANYVAASGLAAGNFVINKATPTASITNSPVIYNGSEQTATVACLGGGAATLASGGVGTNAGSYPATVNCAESANYAAASGLAAGNFVINKAVPTASITNSPAIYSGSEQTATVACSGGGTATLASGGVGINPGSYPATVDCAESANYVAASGLAAGNFVINKATPTASITNSPVVYNGSEQTATVACSGGGAATLVSGGVGTNAGSYPATVDCAESANYTAASGLAAGSFVINKATPTASITNSPVVYNGSEQTAAVACLGGGTATLASGGVGTNAGSYPATVNCAESANYAAASGLAAGNFVIDKATPTASITNSPAIYNGSEQTAAVACSGGGTATLASGGVGTNVGSYPATADCAESANYTAASGLAAGNFVIDPAIPTASVTNSPVTYNGSEQTAEVACSSGGTATLASGGVGTNAGSYPATVDCEANANYEAASGLAAGNFVIEKATLDVTADNQAKFTDEPDLQEQDFTFDYFGFVGDDDENDIDTPPTCNVTGDQSVPGLLDIVCSGGADNNYDFNYIDGTLTVNAVNNPPTDISLSNNTVDENAASGTTVGQLSTTDDDITDTFTYSLVNGGGSCPGTDNASFQISGDLLKTNAVFDFETKDTYVICVETDDGREGTFEKEFIITVNDLEELFTESFKSLGGQDGWILESTTSSNKGGTMNKAANTLRLGDDAGNRQYRAILSFNTDSVPSGATINKVTLQVKRQGVTGGGNPVNKFGGFMIDMKNGPFNTPALALKDFNTKAGQTLGAFKPTPSGGWYTFDLTAGSAQINVDGLTQIRLRFKVDDNGNRLGEFLKLFSGNAAMDNRPLLTIEYYFAPIDN